MKKKTGILRNLLILFGAALALFLLIQLVPYGRNHSNPPVVQEPNWDSPSTRELAQRACFDCHSNETVWPWYSNVAPVSWLVQHDTDEGRSKLNFSDVQSIRELSKVVREISEVVQEGEMPPLQYYPTHPEARLTDQEKQLLIEGLQKSLQ